VLVLLVGVLFHSSASPRLVVASEVGIPQPLTRERLCGFIASLAVDLGGRGVCYTSSNHLAYYVPRYVCGYRELADSAYRFLESYPTDFYDYHQILVGRPIPQPFTGVEHVLVDVVSNVGVVHVRRTANEITDYYRYANPIVYRALHHLLRGDRGGSVEELGRLEGLWDGRGFADAYYEGSGWYETYKPALALYAYKAVSRRGAVERYAAKLMSTNPFTTLYGDSTGEGDLNLETAAVTLLAPYSTPPVYPYAGTGTHDRGRRCHSTDSRSGSRTSSEAPTNEVSKAP